MSLKKPRQMAARRFSAGVAVAFAALLLAPTAAATPWWVAWEGNDFPENGGWERIISGEPSKRVIQDGIMTIDGMGTGGGRDYYKRHLSETMDPDPGELFVARWRLCVEEVGESPLDPRVSIANHERWAVDLIFGVNRVFVVPQANSIYFSPGVFHDWELRSPDMRSYDLLLDGQIVQHGDFARFVNHSYIEWGDGGEPVRSRSAWDYFRVGVVPEPTCLTGLLVLIVGAARVRRR